MALIGSLSGSNGITALTGSLIPGAASNELGSSASKWLTVYASNITGSIRKTGAGDDFIKAGPNITANYNTLGQWEITGASGGGGGGDGIFTAVDASKAYTTSSIAVGFSAAASSKGTAVFFAVSGSDANVNTALFSGPVVSSGSFSVKSAGTTVGTIDSSGVVSGSALQTVGNLSVQGTSALVGDVTVTGDVAVNGGDLTTTATGTATLFNTTATTVNIAGGATAGTNIGNVSGLTTIAGGVKVSGNFISGSASKNLTLGSNGDVTVEGDLTVSGNDIVFSAATGNIANAATSLTIGSGATTLNLGSAAGKVVIPGDLEVQGTTMTVSASNLVIEDPLVGFGFDSGSLAISTTGDRGFIGAYAGAGNNVAFGYSLSNSAFVATKTTSGPGDTTFSVSTLQPIRANRFEVNGSTAFVTGSGTTLTISGSTLFLGSNAAVNFERNGIRVGQIIGADGVEFKLAAQSSTGGATNLVLSGSGVDLSANAQGINFKFADTTRSTLVYNGGTSTVTLGTTGSVSLSLSGTNGVNVIHGTNGTQFINNQGGTAYLVVEADGIDARLKSAADINLRADGGDIKFTSGSSTPLTVTVTGNNANIQGANNQQVAIGAVGSSGIMNVSGSIVNANVGVGGFVFQRDGVDELIVNAVGSTTTISGTAVQNVTLAAGTGATTLTLSGSTVDNQASIAHKFNLGGTLISHVTSSGGRQGFFPGTDSTFDLGGPSIRWANIYTGDLHLRNERGDYTLIEEPDFLSVRFNKNGKRYKFLLERVPELDEPAR
jgi:hypothetical protein